MIYYSVLKSAPAKKRSAGAFAIISDVANAFLQDYQNEKNRDFQSHMLDRQQLFQNELNSNSALVQRQSLERAGLNPNLMSGAPPYGSASVLGDSTSQQAPQVDPSVFNVIAQMQQNQPLVDAQTRKENAEAERMEIENKNLKSENATYENIDNVLKEFSSDGFTSGVLPEVVVIPKNKGWFTAMRNINEFRGEKSDISFKLVHNELNRMVAQGQIKDPKTIESLRDLPYWTTQKLMEETQLAIAHASESRANKEYIDSNKAYVDLKKRLEEDNNIMPYIDKIFQGEFNFESFVKMLVLIGAKQLSK